jgi:hypothetical protein
MSEDPKGRPKTDRVRTYGRPIRNAQPQSHLVVGHILNGTLVWSAEDHPESVLVLAMTTEKLQRLDLSFRDAMFLLSVLRAMQLDTGFQLPDDPRGAPTKQGSSRVN